MREKLYASRIANRKITILDVPEKYRERVMALLGESDQRRNKEILAAVTLTGAS